MATAFALGVMDLVWMSLLMVAVFAEQEASVGKVDRGFSRRRIHRLGLATFLAKL